MVSFLFQIKKFQAARATNGSIGCFTLKFGVEKGSNITETRTTFQKGCVCVWGGDRHSLHSDRSTWRRSTVWTRPCRSISHSRASCHPGGYRIPACSGRSFVPQHSPVAEEKHKVHGPLKARNQEAWGHVTAVLMRRR